MMLDQANDLIMIYYFIPGCGQIGGECSSDTSVSMGFQ